MEMLKEDLDNIENRIHDEGYSIDIDVWDGEERRLGISMTLSKGDTAYAMFTCETITDCLIKADQYLRDNMK